MGQELSEEEIIEQLKPLISEKRLRHTLGVRDMALELARIHQIDPEKARLAALLHDCAKGYSYEDGLKLAKKAGIHDSQFLSSPPLLHGPLGAYLAKSKFGVADEDVLNAIYYHTAGRRNMSGLELCIFVADACELTRMPYPGLEEIRTAAYQSLKEAARLELEHTKAYVLAQGKPYSPLSCEALNWLNET